MSLRPMRSSTCDMALFDSPRPVLAPGNTYSPFAASRIDSRMACAAEDMGTRCGLADGRLTGNCLLRGCPVCTGPLLKVRAATSTDHERRGRVGGVHFEADGANDLSP